MSKVDPASPPEVLATLAEESSATLLQAVVDAARVMVHGCRAATLSVVNDGQPTTMVVSDPAAAHLDGEQFRLGEGPALDLAVHPGLATSADLGRDLRWPRFGDTACRQGFQSLLALSVDAGSGCTLTIYGAGPGAFDDSSRADVLLLGALAEAVLRSERGQTESQRVATNLRTALATRETIGRAQGILMERGRITSERAFDLLLRSSQRLNVKLRDVAEDLVRSGELPSAGARAPTAVGQDEDARLAAVRRYDVLDTPPDGIFDRVAALAARSCDAPIGIITIVDEDRIWFKARHGVAAEQIDRAPGLCASAILHDGPWLVEDARSDPRTLANPLVAGDFGLQFYLGIPLRTQDGHGLGTLCAIDRRPRAVTERQIADLTDLAQLVVDQLELRLAARRRVALEGRLRHHADALAACLQGSLGPSVAPALAGADAAVCYLPADHAEVGGDFYDVCEAEDDSCQLVVGDVRGHGPEATAMAAAARHTLHALCAAGWAPARSLGYLDGLLREGYGGEAFCTVAAVSLRRQGDGVKAVVCLGGHPKPLVLHADGTVEAIGIPGPFVGSVGGESYTESDYSLDPDDVVVLYTDGLVDGTHDGDATWDEDVFRERLGALAGASPQEVVDGIFESMGEASIDLRDDALLLVARVPEAAAAADSQT